MTAKQKAARANFKKAVTDAQKLRKSNPKLTQAQALKQAFAENKKVNAVKKEAAPKKKDAKKIGYKSDRTEILSKATPFIKMYQNKGDSRKEAIKKANKFASTLNGVKKAKPKKKIASSKVKASKGKSTEMHTDTKSHNVNIRVVSGYKQIGNVKFFI